MSRERARLQRTLGTSVVQDVLEGLKNAAQQEATTWLLQQYAALTQLPAQLSSLDRLRQAINTTAGNAIGPADIQALQSSGREIAQLQANYPAMMAGVNRAYQLVQQSLQGNASVSDVATTAVPAILAAQSFASQVTDVRDTLTSMLSRLEQSGAVSPADAQKIAAIQSQRSGSWIPWIVGGIGAAAGLYVLARIFGGRRRRAA